MYRVSKKVKLKIQLQTRQRTFFEFFLNQKVLMSLIKEHINFIILLRLCLVYWMHVTLLWIIFQNTLIYICWKMHQFAYCSVHRLQAHRFLFYYHGTLLSLYYLYFIISTTSSASSLVAFSLNSNLDRALKKSSNANIIYKSD